MVPAGPRGCRADGLAGSHGPVEVGIEQRPDRDVLCVLDAARCCWWGHVAE
jgi:hypothetical protein